MVSFYTPLKQKIWFSGVLGRIPVSTQKMKFSIKDFFSKYDQIRANLVTFTEEIFNEKVFCCAVCDMKWFK